MKINVALRQPSTNNDFIQLVHLKHQTRAILCTHLVRNGVVEVDVFVVSDVPLIVIELNLFKRRCQFGN